MIEQVLKKMQEKFFPKIINGDQRADINIGDQIEVFSYIIDKIKKTRRLTAAEKQANKKPTDEVEKKKKIQIFKGLLIAKNGSGMQGTFIVRKISANNIAVEKTYSLYSPTIQKIVIKTTSVPRRSKLYFLRKKVGKQALKVRGKKI